MAERRSRYRAGADAAPRLRVEPAMRHPLRGRRRGPVGRRTVAQVGASARARRGAAAPRLPLRRPDCGRCGVPVDGRRIEADLQAAATAARVAGGRLSDRLRLGFPPVESHVDVLSVLIERLRALAPEVEVEVRYQSASASLCQLHGGGLDAAVLALPVGSDDGPARVPLRCASELQLVMAERHPLADVPDLEFAHLAGHLVFVPSPQEDGVTANWLGDRLAAVQPSPSCREVPVALLMRPQLLLEREGGVVFRWPDLVSEEPRDGLVFRSIQVPEPPLELVLAAPEEDSSPLVIEVLRLAREPAGQHHAARLSWTNRASVVAGRPSSRGTSSVTLAARPSRVVTSMTSCTRT